ncbi:GNAT family N-acetyltransferase [Chitinophaga arvensicola]|uniref:Acetyltransferase (GNAT) family protein n=1 Tax=Chitinophaga arvensicola TaxID=29529 RepID=A0A1I0S9E3_9BACT|nr:GNAT family N-acetyltransferase [Chitinophaga arvensicola]SEW52711.1 Acetyltransferase (GNAT) family protein [Chitinophaga arvensicola]
MITVVDPQLLETWLTGWSLSRGLPIPVPDHGGFRVDVGWPDQQTRYVFAGPGERLQHLAATIRDPWIFLKVCAPVAVVRALLPDRWVIESPAFMMICPTPMTGPSAELPAGYQLDTDMQTSVPVVRVLTTGGQEAAIGRIVFVNNMVIYDRIATHPDHQRRGLGTVIMKSLEGIAAANGITRGVLVATSAGRALYETLGWQLYAPYTTAVIPGGIVG